MFSFFGNFVATFYENKILRNTSRNFHNFPLRHHNINDAYHQKGKIKTTKNLSVTAILHGLSARGALWEAQRINWVLLLLQDWPAAEGGGLIRAGC
jgi:hypothetical protein